MGIKDEQANIPSHVAVIMDGNGRWAEARGLPRTEGHKAGAEPVRATLRTALKTGVRHLTLYTFSTENWFRSEEEINNLFILLTRYLNSETRELFEKGVKVKAVGDLSRLPAENLTALNNTMEATKNNDSITLTLALSYGARAELTAAARNLSQKVLEGQITPDDIDENAYASELWSAALPDVDLLIRTGGDKRISNFLLWKIAYAELHFTNTLWPDFGEQDFMEAVEDFGSRRRRFGKA